VKRGRGVHAGGWGRDPLSAELGVTGQIHRRTKDLVQPTQPRETRSGAALVDAVDERLAAWAKLGDGRARDALVLRHRSLVRRMARRFRSAGFADDDHDVGRRAARERERLSRASGRAATVAEISRSLGEDAGLVREALETRNAYRALPIRLAVVGAAGSGIGPGTGERRRSGMSVPTPMRRSEESTAAQLELAREQGRALQHAVDAMDSESDSGVLAAEAGNYLIAIAVEEAEGMWAGGGETLEWRDPGDENCHVEVCVRDRADGRFVPSLDVSVTLSGPDGAGEVGTHRQPFLWHPWLYHYGRNWHVPGGGAYRVEVRVDAPEFMRHDHENGRRYADPVTVTFDGVEITPGQKRVET
jgi:Fe2+ transport protein